MKEIECHKCGNRKLIMKQCGKNTDLYCSSCNQWLACMNQDELQSADVCIRIVDDCDDSNNTSEELKFVGMNLIQQILNVMIDKKQSVTKHMSIEETEAYELGVSNTLAYLQVLLSDSDGIVVNTFSQPREYSYSELKEYFDNKK